MAGGYSSESARRALPNNGANYSQLAEEGRGEVGDQMQKIFYIEKIINLVIYCFAKVGEHRQPRLFRLRFRHLALITVRCFVILSYLLSLCWLLSFLLSRSCVGIKFTEYVLFAMLSFLYYLLDGARSDKGSIANRQVLHQHLHWVQISKAPGITSGNRYTETSVLLY